MASEQKYYFNFNKTQLTDISGVLSSLVLEIHDMATCIAHFLQTGSHFDYRKSLLFGEEKAACK